MRYLRITFIAILAVAAILFSSLPAHAKNKTEKCLKTSQDILKLRGTLIERPIPGPPYYEAGLDKKPGFQWILKLDAPVCVTSPTLIDGHKRMIMHDVKEVSLSLIRDQFEIYRHLIGESVVLVGKIWELDYDNSRQPMMISVIYIYSEKANGKDNICLYVERDIAKITGVFYEKTLPGPPNYESIEKGDKPETKWILKLDALVNSRKNDFLRIQLIEIIDNYFPGTS